MVKMEGKALHLNCTVEISEKQLMPATIVWTKDSKQLNLKNDFSKPAITPISNKCIF